MRFTYNVIVIGAGAAGLMTAGKIAESGISVVLFEKMEKPARKVRITGKGRCNITNDTDVDEILKKVRCGNDFIKHALDIFTPQDVKKFFTEMGVDLVVERGSRVFPKSGKAWDVANALEKFALNSGVNIINNTKVDGIIVEDGKVLGVEVISQNNRKDLFYAPCVVVATGGTSYPSTGSTGDGYYFAHETGHKIESVRPSLVSLHINSRYLRVLDGLSLKNVELSLIVNGETTNKEFGEMEFTPYGIGGAITLKISRDAVDAIIDNKSTSITIDLKPALSPQQILARIDREYDADKDLSIESLTRKLVPAKIVATIIKEATLKPYDSVASMSEKQRIDLISTLKCLKFTLCGYGSFNEAIVTAGGVVTNDIDNNTMMSKHVDGLYFVGEVLDIDADTGGYNLQLAFSSAVCAACDIVKRDF